MSDIVLEVRCDGEQIEQNRYYNGVIPRRGDMVQVYKDPELSLESSKQGGFFRVREIVTILDGHDNGMKITYLVCDREDRPRGLFK